MTLLRHRRQVRAFATLPAVAGVAFLLLAFLLWWWPPLMWWMFIIFFALIGVGLLVFALKMSPSTPSSPQQ